LAFSFLFGVFCFATEIFPDIIGERHINMRLKTFVENEMTVGGM